MRYQLTLLFSICSFWAFSQIESGCLYLDFENFSNAASGLVISDQFKDDFGVTFSLEGGGAPVLANVGLPEEAFGSAWGRDTPAPGVDIGEFFLTDDGVLSGITSPPLILTFETPIDSFAGCILDLDLTEEFLIQAMDEDGNVILQSTLRDGDPGTGDGALTCWGFNLDGCEGKIYSIRYQGTRTQSGFFGLGLDNFSFCYSGLNIDVDREPQTCTENGSLHVKSTGSSDQYTYSIDGINYFEDGLFEDLEAGPYTVYVLDEFGCEAEVPEFVPLFEAYIAGIDETPTNCGLDNGVIVVDVGLADGAVYSLDGISFQQSNVFENVPAGNYTIYVEDDNGCELFTSAFIPDSDGPTFDPFGMVDDSCEKSIGEITVNAQGTNLEYSIDDSDFKPENIFENLPAGDYEISIKDDDGCVVKDSVSIKTTPAVFFGTPTVEPATCDELNGVVEITASGGAGIIEYSMDGLQYRPESKFGSLDGGSYVIYLLDENDCADTLGVDVPSPEFAFINEISVEHTACDGTNGSFVIDAPLAPGLQFSINGGELQDSPFFGELLPGDYTINLIDENGCEAIDTRTIDPSFGPELEFISSTEDICNNSNGTLEVSGSSPNGDVKYEIDENGVDNITGLFEDLEEGEHSVIVTDELGCTAKLEIEIDSTPVVQFYGADVTEPSCYNYDGVIVLNVGGGTGEFSYIIDGIPADSSVFRDLAPGDHEITIIDELGCETTNKVNVPEPLCPIYIPDIFNPKEPAPNNRFIMYANEAYMAHVNQYVIYDRWGELVYISEDFSIHETGDFWWDGFFNDSMSEQDVYTYYMELVHPRGDVEHVVGTLFLMK